MKSLSIKTECRVSSKRKPRLAGLFLAMIAIVAFSGLTASAQELLTNGDFETGTFAGWTVVNQPGGAGDYFISTPGTATPDFGYATAPNADGGDFYAVSDTTSPGSHVLYQSFVIPAGSPAVVTLNFQMFVNNQGISTATPPSLNYATFPNQQATVSILNSIASPFTVSSGVVRTFYDGTDNGNPNPYVTYTFHLALTPGTYYLRFAEVDNQGPLNQGIDNVSLTDNGVLPSFSLAGLTPNQQAVLGSVNHGISTGNVTPSFTNLAVALFNNPGGRAALATALDTLSPEKLQIFSNVALDNFGFTARQLDSHLASLRYGKGGFDTSGLQVLDSSMPSTLSQIKNRLLAFSPAPASRGLVSDSASPVLGGVKMSDPKNMQGVSAPVTDQNRWSSFVSGNVILADIGSDPDVSSARYTTGGVMAGSDYRLNDNWAVGGLFTYGHSALTLDNNGSTGRVDSYSPGIYATYADHGWFANGLFAYNYNSYGETRQIPVLNGAAHGSTTGNQYGANFDGGYEFHSGDWTYGPTAALQYVHLDINDFTEAGAGALGIDSQDTDSLRSRLGGQVRYNFSLYGGRATATPYLGVSWQHEYLDDSRGITSQFNGAGIGSFTVNTTSQDRDSAVITAGIDTQWNSAFNLFIDYQAQAGQSDFFAQSIEGGAKVSF